MSENYDRVNAQVAVLGSMLIDDRAVATVLHRVREEDMAGQYRTIYRAIRKLFQNGQPVDLVTVGGTLGPEYSRLLIDIADGTPTAANVESYVDLLLEQGALARLRELGAALSGSPDLEAARELVSRINREEISRPGVRVVNMEQGIMDFYERQTSKPDLVPWGMKKLDNVVRTEPGDFVVIGGYSSAGKTALSVQLAWAQAEERKVGYFSLETKPEKLIDRTVAMVTGIEFDRIKAHTLLDDDWVTCAGHANALKDRRLEVIQAGGLSVAEIQALTLAGQYDLIYIDYLQLVLGDNRRDTEYDRVTKVSMALHTMAQTTGITVVALSQLTRPEKDGKKEKAPGLHSLRQSGQIEQDADGVLLLYKEEPDLPNSRRCLKVAKNKDGEAGGILLLNFQGRIQRFIPCEPDYKGGQQFRDSGKAVKQANRARASMEQMHMKELTGKDPDDLWGGKSDDKAAEKADRGGNDPAHGAGPDADGAQDAGGPRGGGPGSGAGAGGA